MTAHDDAVELARKRLTAAQARIKVARTYTLPEQRTALYAQATAELLEGMLALFLDASTHTPEQR